METPRLLALFAGLKGQAGSGSAWGQPVAPNYTREMTVSLLAHPDSTSTRRHDAVPESPADPRAGLTEDDTARIAAAITAACAETTRTVYAFAWRRWTSWCTGRGIVPFPAEPAAVCAYLTHCADQGLSPATIDSACSAIGHQHRSAGVPDPIDHDAVRQVRRGLRRIIGRAPRRPARPLSVADLRQIVTAIDLTTVRGIRDTAILLLGFAGALRRSELAALTLADLEAKPGGLLVHLRRSKTDTEARGQVVGIAKASTPLPTRSPPSTPGSRSTAATPARSSPACAAGVRQRPLWPLPSIRWCPPSAGISRLQLAGQGTGPSRAAEGRAAPAYPSEEGRVEHV